MQLEEFVDFKQFERGTLSVRRSAVSTVLEIYGLPDGTDLCIIQADGSKYTIVGSRKEVLAKLCE